MDFNKNNNTDEFFWEKEFRRDDTRINSYMREIPAVIDLPEEDKLLMKRLLKQPEYAKNAKAESPYRELLDFDDILFPSDWRGRDGAALYADVERLMSEWCTLYAAELKDKNNVKGVQVLCLYGKIMGESIDVIDIGEEAMPGLKIALCKRIASDVNAIVTLIRSIDDFSGRLKAHLRQLNELRDSAVKLLFRLKHETDSN